MPGDFRVEVKGLAEWHRGLKTLMQPELKMVVGGAMKESMQRIAVPAIKAAAPKGPAPHTSAARGKRGRKGPLSKNVTTQIAKSKYRRDPREMVAYNTGPRAWYRHFVIQGTARHSLAKGARRSRGTMQNVPPIHPGSTADNFVEEAVSGKNAEVAAYLGGAVIRRYAQAVR